jgi:hypothetical protein
MRSDRLTASWSSRRADRFALVRSRTHTARTAEMHAPAAATRCMAAQDWQSAGCGQASSPPNTTARPRPLDRKNRSQTRCSSPPQERPEKRRTPAHRMPPGYSETHAREDYPQPPAAHLAKKKAPDSTVANQENGKTGKLRKSLGTNYIARPSSRSSLARGRYQQRQIFAVSACTRLQTNLKTPTHVRRINPQIAEQRRTVAQAVSGHGIEHSASPLIGPQHRTVRQQGPINISPIIGTPESSVELGSDFQRVKIPSSISPFNKKASGKRFKPAHRRKHLRCGRRSSRGSNPLQHRQVQ